MLAASVSGDLQNCAADPGATNNTCADYPELKAIATGKVRNVMAAKRVNNKQRAFIKEYLRDFNGSKAAIRAGYSRKSAYAIGSELLKKPEIQKAIRQDLEERLMSADEDLKRLAEMARGDMGDFLDISSMSYQLDLNKAKELGITHLIKKVRQKTVTTVDKDGHEEETNTIEIELYDAQEALNSIGKYHGLFVDRTELTGAAGKALIDEEKIAKALHKVYGEKADGMVTSGN